MFTGIVEELGSLHAIEELGDSARLSVCGPLVVKDARPGDSIAVNGVCLTVVDVEGDMFTADVMKGTLDRSALGALSEGDPVNLERAATLSSRLGGHLVQGHVDGVGRIAERRREGEWEVVWFSCPPVLAEQMVPKGSVAVDGISLTLVEVTSDRFSVALIPHTLAVTTLGFKQPGASVNLETDLLAKYVWKCLRGGGVTYESLKQTGFLRDDD